ncbi:hypothetical protein CPJCM30710_32740 [Clostridium polyendosporum]|uniref:HTH domain-containing protein n=1 Tax=Clostridium polyendosporum TaxID=69208 RepID=A0A919S4T8_9CLOT|nr:hypothetical protein [Clostridium polyendosporum]GIM30608.1 hypothetical protein CPJCM30710_32740 [Clostridium polyendosporum]
MLRYSDYKKPRCLFELFRLIKSGYTNKEELAQMFDIDKKIIYNYIEELNLIKSSNSPTPKAEVIR